jgi:iron complex transport system permease protein
MTHESQLPTSDVFRPPVRLGDRVQWGLGLLLVACLLAGAGVGAVAISPAQVLSILLERIGIEGLTAYSEQQAGVFFAIRLPRVLFGLVVGVGLSVSGVAMQAVFRNPLADPGVTGLSSGAACAAVACIVFNRWMAGILPPWAIPFELPVAAFAGAWCASRATVALARRGGVTSVGTMLLAGIAVTVLAEAARGLMIFGATDDQLRAATFWGFGSLGGGTWATLGILALFVLPPSAFLLGTGRRLNALLLGDAEAGHLGLDVERLKRWAILCATLAVGASVAFCGIIVFVGLVVPHLLRMAIGPDHRRLLPGSALLGASVLIGADLVSRTCVRPAELPIGVVTGLVGAPFFFWLLANDRSLGGVK